MTQQCLLELLHGSLSTILQIKLCQKWILFRSELAQLVTTSPSNFLFLLRLLTWSCDSLSYPHINPSLLLRVIEVYLDPLTFDPDAAPVIILRLSNHLVKRQFFQSLLTLLKQKAPPPDDITTTPPPLVGSVLSFMTRPLSYSQATGSHALEALANEVLSHSRSPYVSYYIVPHLMTNSDLNLAVLIHCVLSGVVRGGVAPTVELLYAIVQLCHPKLTSSASSDHFLQDYLQLVSTLLDHAPLSHVTSGEVKEDDDDDSDSDVMMEDNDPLSSCETMMFHCLVTLGGPEIVTCMNREK